MLCLEVVFDSPHVCITIIYGSALIFLTELCCPSILSNNLNLHKVFRIGTYHGFHLYLVLLPIVMSLQLSSTTRVFRPLPFNCSEIGSSAWLDVTTDGCNTVVVIKKLDCGVHLNQSSDASLCESSTRKWIRLLSCLSYCVTLQTKWLWRWCHSSAAATRSCQWGRCCWQQLISF